MICFMQSKEALEPIAQIIIHSKYFAVSDWFQSPS